MRANESPHCPGLILPDMNAAGFIWMALSNPTNRRTALMGVRFAVTSNSSEFASDPSGRTLFTC
jgi:hypothetical protein